MAIPVRPFLSGVFGKSERLDMGKNDLGQVVARILVGLSGLGLIVRYSRLFFWRGAGMGPVSAFCHGKRVLVSQGQACLYGDDLDVLYRVDGHAWHFNGRNSVVLNTAIAAVMAV